MLVLGNKLTLNALSPTYHFVNKYSIVFDGVDDKIITDGADTVLQNTTYSFWSKSSKATDNTVFGHGSFSIGTFVLNNGGTRPRLRFGTSIVLWNNITQQDDGEWHHWVVYADPNNVNNSKLYCDSVLQTVSSATSGTPTAYTESLTIGCDQAASGGSFFTGNIDEFATFDRELTQAEITRMYNTFYSPNRVANGNFAQIGNEEVTNGDFDTDSDWTKGANTTISGGKLNSNSAGVYIIASQSAILTQNQTCKYSVTYTITSGSVRLGDSATVWAGSTQSTSGTYTGYITVASNANGTLFFTSPNSDFVGSIDNVSVKEVGQHWTLPSNTTVENDKLVFQAATGLVSQTPINTVNGRTYKVIFTVSDRTAGSVEFNFSGISTVYGTNRTTNGTFTQVITTTSNNHSFNLYASGFTGKVDNVSVKEADRNNVPRIDYTGGGCPHILSEPQRTNSLFQSNQFDTTWVLTNSSVVGNQSGIYNTTDAWKLVGNGANNDRLNSNSLSSGAYTFSIYAKAGNSKFTAVVLGSAVVYYNLETGSVGSAANVTNSSIESVGNDWYRLTLSVASFTGSAQIYIANGVGNVNTSNGDFIYLQHAQAEVGSYATSIIPTSGSTVTRNQDQFSRDGISSLINSTEGVFFAEIAALFEDDGNRVIRISDGGGNTNAIEFRYASDGNLYYDIWVGGASKFSGYYTSFTQTNANKIAIKYKENDFALWVNGTEVATDTSGVTFSANTLNDLSLSRGAQFFFYGKAKQLQVYKTALTDLQIESITSWTSFTEMANSLNYTIY